MENEKDETNHLKVVHRAEDVKNDGKKPLSFDELMAEISTKGTVQEREQVVIENLRRKGLI